MSKLKIETGSSPAGERFSITVTEEGPYLVYGRPPLAEQLKRLLAPASRRDIQRHLDRVAGPALESVGEGLAAEGLTTEVTREGDGLLLLPVQRLVSGFVLRRGLGQLRQQLLRIGDGQSGREAKNQEQDAKGGWRPQPRCRSG